MGKKDSSSFVFPFPAGELLQKGLSELGFRGVDGEFGTVGTLRGLESLSGLINRYIKELELFNKAFDLVGAEPGSEQGRSDLVVRHILDSLSAWKEIASLSESVARSGKAVEIADAGTGAGFPGIPLSIAFPDLHFTLIERMSKRCAFLENCVALLGLKNVSIVNSEVEKAPAASFDIVVFRAFRPLDRDMTKTLLRLLRRDAEGKVSGRLAAWKALRVRIDEEMGTIANEVEGWDIVELKVPFLAHEERHLVVIPSMKPLYQPD
jgi:16S rRNA (guanine527-N7)-methyltransferase